MNVKTITYNFSPIGVRLLSITFCMKEIRLRDLIKNFTFKCFGLNK